MKNFHKILIILLVLAGLTGLARFFVLPNKAQAAACSFTSFQAQVIGDQINFTWTADGFTSGQAYQFVIPSSGPAIDIDPPDGTTYSLAKPADTTDFFVQIIDPTSGTAICQTTPITYTYDATTGTGTISGGTAPTTGGGGGGGTAGTPHAMDLHADLVQSTTTQGWMFDVWKVTLGLADIFVVLVLLFLAIVNILHIQYDTYAIKKTLPKLIIGVVMANFSVLICRMIVDVAQVLSNTFIGQDPHEFVSKLICSVALKAEANGFYTFALSGASLILNILFFFLILIGIVIAAFLLYIRFVVIYALVAAAPLAFIMLAFPPTESIFKKWWGWFSQWVFLAPVMMFVFWMASLVGQTNCHGFSLTAMILAIALIYIGCLVPFKMGGAVMSAWSGFGKKAGGWLAKKADYGLAKYTKWSPSSAYQAYKIGAEQKREEAFAAVTGKQRDVWGKLTGKETAYREQAERTIGLKRVKEQVGDLDLSSREGLAEAFRRMEKNKDDLGMQALLEHAAANNMVADVMSEADEETKRKYGAGLLDESGDLKTDLVSQRTFTERVIGGGRDPQNLTQNQYKSLNRIQESWIKSGIANAKNVVRDARTGKYRRLDLASADDRALYDKMTTRRFWSAPARKGMLNLRKETLFDSENNLTDEGLRLLRKGLLTSEHITMLHNARGNVLEAFAKAGNLERLDAAGAPGLAIKQKLMTMGFGSNLGATQAVVVSGENAQQREIGELSADEMGDVNVQASILQRIQTYNAGATEGAANLAAIRGAVQSSGASPEVKARFNAMVDLKLAQAQAQQLDTADATQAESLLGQVSQTVQSQVASALDHGIDVLPILSGVVSSVKGPMQIRLKQAVKEGIRRSQQVIISPGGNNIQCDQIAIAYDEAVANLPRGVTEDQRKMRFISSLQALAHNSPLSGPEMHKAWQLAEAYIGKPPRREGGRQTPRRRFITPEEEEAAAAEEEEQP